jgi:ubiquitin conjugation factor E4 B
VDSLERMLKLFTDALADSFTMPEIVQRLADMLDYNLDAMVYDRPSRATAKMKFSLLIKLR